MCCFCFLIFFYPTIPNASEVDQMVWTSSILELRKSTTLTYINQYRCVGRNNPQLNCTWDFSKSKENKTGLFSPSTFTVLLTLETGLAAFPSFFSKQKCMCLLCTPAVAGSGDARGAGMSQARCGCGSSPFLQRAARIPHEPDKHVAQQAVHGVPQAGCTQAVSSRQSPAVQKAPEVVMFFVFFFFLCINSLSGRGQLLIQQSSGGTAIGLLWVRQRFTEISKFAHGWKTFWFHRR